MGKVKKCSNKKFYIHTAITVALMVGVGFLPPFGQITPLGMKVLGVFLGMMYGWIFVELTWPSILGILWLALTGYATVNEIFGTIFNSTIIQCLLTFLAANLFDRLKATDYIAAKVLSSKFLAGKSWMLIIGIFMTTAIIALLSTSIAAIFLMWSVALKMTEELGYEYNDKFTAFIIAGIVYSGAFGDMLLPFKATTIAYIGFASSVLEINIPVLNYFLLMVLFVVAITGLYILFGKYVLKVDVSHFAEKSDIFAHMRGQKATKNQKIGLTLVLSFMLALLLPSFLPKIWIVTQFLSGLGLTGVCVLVIVFGAWLKDEEGRAVAPIEKLFDGVGWSLIWLLASTFPIAAALRSPDVGVMATINSYVTPLVSGLSVTTLIILAVIVLGVLTQLTHNGVLAIMFYPIVLPLVDSMGGNPLAAWFVMFLILQCAFSTPAASMYSGFVFGHKSLASSKISYILGASIFAFGLVVVLALLPLANSLL